MTNLHYKMKKYIFLIFITYFQSTFSQDVVTLKHRAYITSFDVKKQYPVMVQWWVTKNMFSCNYKYNRISTFSIDPKLKDYTNLNDMYKHSGYDRGHVFPALYGECDYKTMKESFYYSNMMPQTPSLNRGDWKMVEELTKLESVKYDSVYVWAGGIGEAKKLGTMSVPEYCWKVIYIKKTKEYFAFLFKNDFSRPNGINDNKVEISLLEKMTGYTFKIL